MHIGLKVNDNNILYTEKGMQKKKANLDEDGQYKAFIKKVNPELEGKAYEKWKNDENILYARFLRQNLEEYNGDNNDKIPMFFFNRMSQTIKIGRNNRQCRSHHQKMLKKFNSVQKIIQSLLLLHSQGQNNQSSQEKQSLAPENTERKNIETQIRIGQKNEQENSLESLYIGTNDHTFGNEQSRFFNEQRWDIDDVLF